MQLSLKDRYEIIIRHEKNQSSRQISSEMNINRKTVPTFFISINMEIKKPTKVGRLQRFRYAIIYKFIA